MSIAGKVAKGSLTLLLIQLILRSLGLVSTLVLARVLTPEDFGLVAIVSMVVFLFDILSESGTQQYIIQKDNVDQDDLNTAWTINILLKAVVWVIFIIFTPVIDNSFENHSLKVPLYLISLMLLISGFYNPGMYIHQKNLMYAPLFKLEVMEKIISVLVTISLALYLQNYWAMIIGLIVSYSLKALGSHILHKNTLNLSLCRLRQQWSFSSWMLCKGLLGYTRAQVDILLVSKYFGLTALGGYNMMKELSAMPGRDIINPATAPLLSSFSKTKNSINALKHQAQVSLLIICIGIFPIAFFVFEYHNLIVLTLLGPQWVEYSMLLGIMSILMFTHPFFAVFQHLLISLGKVKHMFFFDLLTVMLLVCVLIGVKFDSLEQFTLVRSFLGLISIVLLILMSNRIISLDLGKLFTFGFLLVFSCLLSQFIISTFSVMPIVQAPLLQLIVNTLIFFSIYSTIALSILITIKTAETAFIREKLIYLFKSILAISKNMKQNTKKQ